MRVGNSSAKYVAWGAYIRLWPTLTPRKSASQIRTGVPVSISQKNGMMNTSEKIAPAR